MKKLIRIVSIYGEEFYRIELKRNMIGIFTDKGFVSFDDISFVDIIGKIDEEER